MNGLKRILNYLRKNNGYSSLKLKNFFEFKVNGKILTMYWEQGRAKSIFVDKKRKLTLSQAFRALDK